MNREQITEAVYAVLHDHVGTLIPDVMQNAAEKVADRLLEMTWKLDGGSNPAQVDSSDDPRPHINDGTLCWCGQRDVVSTGTRNA